MYMRMWSGWVIKSNKSFDLLDGENAVFAHLNLGIFSDPIGEKGKNAVFFLNVGISFTTLRKSKDGFRRFLPYFVKLFC